MNEYTCWQCGSIEQESNGEFKQVKIDGMRIKDTFFCKDCIEQSEFAEQEEKSQIFKFTD